jgi:hypothetical protein
MPEIRCPDHVKKCQDHADSLPQKSDRYDRFKPPRESLDRCLDRYKDDTDKLVVIMEEPKSPYSFYFRVYTRDKEGGEWRYWYDGGYILSDYSNNWSIHT